MLPLTLFPNNTKAVLATPSVVSIIRSTQNEESVQRHGATKLEKALGKMKAISDDDSKGPDRGLQALLLKGNLESAEEWLWYHTA